MNLFTLLCDIVANLIQKGGTGIPVIQLEAGMNSMASHPVGKRGALFGFALLDDDGEVIRDELALRLAADVESSVDLHLAITLSIESARPGLSAGEILRSVVKALGEKGVRLGEDWNVGFELEEQKHVGTDTAKRIDYFSAAFAVVLVRRKDASAQS